MVKIAVDLDIAVHADAWTLLLPTYKALCNSALLALFDNQVEFGGGELSLALVSDVEIQNLNRKYRGQDKTTNVLSFPAGFSPAEAPILGDIIIALETTQSEAKKKSIAFSDHFSHLFIHGFLHLLGYDHEDTKDAEVMESLEVSVLKALGIKNPYVL